MARGQSKPAEKPNLTYAEAKAKGLTLDYDVSYRYQGTTYTPLKSAESVLLSEVGGPDAFRSQEWWAEKFDKEVDRIKPFFGPSWESQYNGKIIEKATAGALNRAKEELTRTQRDVARGQLATRRLFRGTGGLLSGGQAGTISKEPTIGAIEKPMLSTSGRLAMEAPLGAKRGLK